MMHNGPVITIDLDTGADIRIIKDDMNVSFENYISTMAVRTVNDILFPILTRYDEKIINLQEKLDKLRRTER